MPRHMARFTNAMANTKIQGFREHRFALPRYAKVTCQKLYFNSLDSDFPVPAKYC